jgi:predicted HTH transcriptional regulator
MGTGIPDMIKSCVREGLSEPELIQEESFKTILWRRIKAVGEVTEQVPEQVTLQVTPQVTPQVAQLTLIIEGEQSREELQEILLLKDRENFRKLYLAEALDQNIIEMTVPNKPNSKNQKYRLTAKGIDLQQKIKREKSGI